MEKRSLVFLRKPEVPRIKQPFFIKYPLFFLTIQEILVHLLARIAEKDYTNLVTFSKRGEKMEKENQFLLWFDELERSDVSIVGGISSSLGEMTSKTDVPVPYGFATTPMPIGTFWNPPA
jgi:hypothetical protein